MTLVQALGQTTHVCQLPVLHQLCGQAKLLNLSVLFRCCLLEEAEHGVERWLELMSVKGLKQCLANRKYAIHFEYYYYYYFCVLSFFSVAPVAYGGSQARGLNYYLLPLVFQADRALLHHLN